MSARQTKEMFVLLSAYKTRVAIVWWRPNTLDRRQDPGVDEQLIGIFLMSRRDVWDEPFLSVKQNLGQCRHYLTTVYIN